MNELNPIIINLLKNPVFLSYATVCPECGTNVRLVGEHKPHGNWYCPKCMAYWPYDTLTKSIRWEKKAWRVQNPSEVLLDNSPMAQYNPVPVNEGVIAQPRGAVRSGASEIDLGGGGVLLEEPFPQNLDTGFLVPSYGYKLNRKRRYLLAVAEDGTRTGRIKGPSTWSFDLVWKNRSREEYETLLAFWELKGYANVFSYRDAIRQSDHLCYFDSEIEAEASSFDVLDFSCTITE